MHQHTHTQVEEWRPVYRYEGRYEISDRGRLRSVERMITTRNGQQRLRKQTFLSPFESKDGHLRVGLYNDQGGRKKEWIHALVLEAFHSPRPDGMIALHRDGNPQNNSPSNLKWGTHSENVLDAVEHGTHWESNLERCKRGHLLEEWNIEPGELRRKNKRMCRSCRYAHCLAQRKPEVKKNLKPWADGRYLRYLEAHQITDPGFTAEPIN